MRMTDIVSSLELTVFPIVGLILFGGSFLIVTIRALTTSRSSCERWKNLPLESDSSDAQQEDH